MESGLSQCIFSTNSGDDGSGLVGRYSGEKRDTKADFINH